MNFARRAFRRPLTDKERTGLLAFYQTLRTREGLTHEDAIRDSVVSVLMSPNFLFRMDLDAQIGSLQPAGQTVRTQLAALRNPVAPPSKNDNNGTIQTLPDLRAGESAELFPMVESAG